MDVLASRKRSGHVPEVGPRPAQAVKLTGDGMAKQSKSLSDTMKFVNARWGHTGLASPANHRRGFSVTM